MGKRLRNIWAWTADEGNARVLTLILLGVPALAAGATYVFSTLFPAPIEVMTIRAIDFTSAFGANAAVPPDGNCKELAVLNQLSDTSSTVKPSNVNEVHYLIPMPRAGHYELMVEYATAKEARSIMVRLGEQVIDGALSGWTDGWCVERARWDRVGTFSFSRGSNDLVLHRDGPFPHLRTIRLVRLD